MKTNIVHITTETNDVPKMLSDTTISTTLWFSGCHGECKNCQNKNLQTPYPGLTTEKLCIELSKRRMLCDWVVLCGGEPMMNYNLAAVKEVVEIASTMDYKMFLYTGYEYEDIKEVVECMDIVEYIKCGKYDETLENSDYLLASTNQYIVDKTGQKIYFFENGSIVINI
jgi:organic radical activating enzyme